MRDHIVIPIGPIDLTATFDPDMIVSAQDAAMMFSDAHDLDFREGVGVFQNGELVFRCTDYARDFWTNCARYVADANEDAELPTIPVSLEDLALEALELDGSTPFLARLDATFQATGQRRASPVRKVAPTIAEQKGGRKGWSAARHEKFDATIAARRLIKPPKSRDSAGTFDKRVQDIFNSALATNLPAIFDHWANGGDEAELPKLPPAYVSLNPREQKPPRHRRTEAYGSAIGAKMDLLAQMIGEEERDARLAAILDKMAEEVSSPLKAPEEPAKKAPRRRVAKASIGTFTAPEGFMPKLVETPPEPLAGFDPSKIDVERFFATYGKPVDPEPRETEEQMRARITREIQAHMLAQFDAITGEAA